MLSIQTIHLTKSFESLTAVKDLSLEVKAGEIFGLVGPDAAGKTTTLRMLCGILVPDGGEATVAGCDIRRETESLKEKVGYLPQRFGLYGDLTVTENLTFYADIYQVPRADRKNRFDRLFHFSNLGPFRDRLAGQLSGGMKQKLALSCALVHQPEVLLLDEPTFGVDPVSRRDLWLIVHDMVAEGVTAVVSTAYMDEAERFDRVALLDRGHILALDTPTVLQEGLSGTVLSVRVDRPREARLVLASHPSVRRAAVFGDRIHVSATSAANALPAIRLALETGGFVVSSVEPVTASMEDVFIDRIADAGSTPAGSAAAGAPPQAAP